MLAGKKVYIVITRGGKYRGTPADMVWSMLAFTLGFLGMHELTPVFAERLNMDPQIAMAVLVV